MKYNVECLVDEYVSCAPDLAIAKKTRLPTIVFTKKGQGAVFNSAKEFEPYARGFNGLSQIKKIGIKAESDLPPVAPAPAPVVGGDVKSAPVQAKPEVKEKKPPVQAKKVEPKPEPKVEAKPEEKS